MIIYQHSSRKLCAIICHHIELLLPRTNRQLTESEHAAVNKGSDRDGANNMLKICIDWCLSCEFWRLQVIASCANFFLLSNTSVGISKTIKCIPLSCPRLSNTSSVTPNMFTSSCYSESSTTSRPLSALPSKQLLVRKFVHSNTHICFSVHLIDSLEILLHLYWPYSKRSIILHALQTDKQMYGRTMSLCSFPSMQRAT